MFQFLAPHLRFRSVLDLAPEALRAHGRNGLLLDVDCTLKDYGSESIPRPVIDWLGAMRSAGVRMCILSNGKARRIEPLARSLELPYVAKAFKPLPLGCNAALRKLGLTAEETAIIGDQLFADVMAGKLARLLTILVEPTTRVEPIWTRVKRPLERFVLGRIAAPAMSTLSAGERACDRKFLTPSPLTQTQS